MARSRSKFYPAFTIVIAILIAIISLPSSYRQWAPGFLKNPSFHYGLDLAGGTQLDFRISEREMQEQLDQLDVQIVEAEASGNSDEALNLEAQKLAIEDQQRNIVEAIRTVLERRINALGVSEAVITPSYLGGEKHLLVECPGVIDPQECINTVGKTIQLEFKEEFTEPTAEFEEGVKAKVADTVRTLTESGLTLEVVGQDLQGELGVAFTNETQYFLSDLPEGLGTLWNRSPDAGFVELEGSIQQPELDGQGGIAYRTIPGIFLAETTRPRTQTGRTITEVSEAMKAIEGEGQARYEFVVGRSTEEVDSNLKSILLTAQSNSLNVASLDDGSASLIYLNAFTQGKEEMQASHILVSYVGANSAGEDVTRTKEEAEAFAGELLGKLQAGEDFEETAKEHSDGPSGIEGGSLGTFDRSQMVTDFSNAAFALRQGEYSDVTETQFGFHIIRADSNPGKLDDRATYHELSFTGSNAESDANATKLRIEKGEVTTVEDVAFVRSIFFSLMPTGWKDTTLDGKHFRSATVTLDPVTNFPIVQITFDSEGGRLFQELTKTNIGKRIAIFVGGDLVSAPTVQAEIAGGIAVITGSQTYDEAKRLAQDLNTGAIPAPIYLAGQRTVEATLGAEALQTSLKAALIGVLILMVYMLLVYRMLGLIAALALCIYAIIFAAILKLPLFLFSSQHIVLTLAGMAGIILSIGMAVDANVLIFERMKEELRKGKMLSTAAETGFLRAWPSIRDGNVSTFITCAILFTIGTSIIRGFAVTLGMGVLISMFSAIVITRWLIGRIARSPLAEKTALFGGKKAE